MTDGKVSPGEGDVAEAAKATLAANESLGIGKLCAQILKENPEWTLSEKRLKTILKQAGLKWGDASSSEAQAEPTTNGNGNSSSSKKKKKSGGAAKKGDSTIPSSRLDKDVPMPSGVRAVYFDEVKGKGLVADREFKEGETLFTEEAFVAAPPAHAYNQVASGELCTLRRNEPRLHH